MNSLKVGDSLKNFLMKLRAYDEEIPEKLIDDVEEMTDEMIEAISENEEEKIEEKREEDKCYDESDLEEKIKTIVERILNERFPQKDETMTSLEEFETDDNFGEEVKEKEDEVGEESVIVSPEKASESVSEIIKKIKPIVASVSDSNDRKMLADSIAKLAKNNKKNTADYNAIFKATHSNMKSNEKLSDDDYGDFLKKKYNPHYNKGE